MKSIYGESSDCDDKTYDYHVIFYGYITIASRKKGCIPAVGYWQDFTCPRYQGNGDYWEQEFESVKNWWLLGEQY